MPEAPSMPPRGRAVMALLCADGQAGRVSVTTQNWELSPIMGSECSLLIYPSVCLHRWTKCRSFSEAEPEIRLRAQ